MRRLSLAGYLFVFLWSAWFFAIQGVAVGGELGPWTPDLGLVLLLALDSRLSGGDARRMALVVSLARSSFSCDSTAAIITGYLGGVGVSSALRAAMEVDGYFLRSILACVYSGVLSAWWIVCHQLGLGAELYIAPQELWPSAISTALCALLVGPLLVGLPGFSSIRKRGRRR